MKADKIVKIVAEEFGVRPLDILGRSRRKFAAIPRFVVYSAIYRHCRWSTPQIGRGMGGRDHATILQGMDRLRALMAADPDLRYKVSKCEAKIKGKPVEMFKSVRAA